MLRKVILFGCQQPVRWRACLKAHLNISVQTEVFIRRGGQGEQKEIRGTGCGCVGSILSGPDMDL